MRARRRGRGRGWFEKTNTFGFEKYVLLHTEHWVGTLRPLSCLYIVFATFGAFCGM